MFHNHKYFIFGIFSCIARIDDYLTKITSGDCAHLTCEDYNISIKIIYLNHRSGDF